MTKQHLVPGYLYRVSATHPFWSCRMCKFLYMVPNQDVAVMCAPEDEEVIFFVRYGDVILGI